MQPDDYVLPKEIRDGLAHLPEDMDTRNPVFLDTLLSLTVSDEERKKIWKETGRPECYGAKDDI